MRFFFLSETTLKYPMNILHITKSISTEVKEKKKAIKNYICLDLSEAWGLSKREDVEEREWDR